MDRNFPTGAILRGAWPLGACLQVRTGALLRATFAAAVLSLSAGSARANTLISIDKSTQQMLVSVDGVPRYRWVVSTGRAGYGPPSGTYRPQRMERTWFSKEYYNSPMPHSIFFHGGYAIHGSLRDPSPRRPRFPWLHQATSRERRYAVRPGQAEGE
jgi:L,D-transpeptidase catalytic domain